MFKLIKRFAAVAILMAFTAPAFAGKYCVNFPAHWFNSQFTKRDNDIHAEFQFKVHYAVFENGRSTTVREDWQKVFAHHGTYEKWRSSFHGHEERDGWFKWCHNMTWITDHMAGGDENSGRFFNQSGGFQMTGMRPNAFRAVGKHGIKCPTIDHRNNGFNRDHNFYIHRRYYNGGFPNNISPWICRSHK